MLHSLQHRPEREMCVGKSSLKLKSSLSRHRICSQIELQNIVQSIEFYWFNSLFFFSPSLFLYSFKPTTANIITVGISSESPSRAKHMSRARARAREEENFAMCFHDCNTIDTTR